MERPKGVEAVDRALKILECFEPGRQEISLAEISRHTGFYKSTILRLATSLENFGYIVKGESSRFRLGPSLWRLGSRYRLSFDLADIIRPELKLLSEVTNETASYYIREGNSRICLFRSEPIRAIRHSINEGSSMPLDRGASGKILLAFSENPTEGDEAVRKAGYTVSLGERDSEVAAVSVPLMSRTGTLMGAIAVSGLITRFGADRHPDLVAALKNCQKQLSPQISI